MLYYLGICISIWLAVGFLSGVKDLYVDQIWNGLQKQKEIDSKNMDDGAREIYLLFLKSKANYLAVCTLSGLLHPAMNILYKVKNKGEK